MKMNRFLLLMVTGLLLCGNAVAQPADATRLPFNIQAQRLDTALTAFAQTTGMQLLFPTDVAMDRQAPEVSGSLTADAALRLLLKDSGLSYRYVNARTVAINPEAGEKKKASSIAASTAVLQVAQARPQEAVAQGEPVRQPSESSDSSESMDQGTNGVIEVTGSRIRTLLGESTTTPTVIFTRQDIERSGVSTIGELGRMIPQAFPADFGQAYEGIGFGGQMGGTAAPGDGGLASATRTTRATINLRGLGAENTLVLVNGRRLAKTGLISGSDANDLAGIPISSIERIEVLTDGASAIYGSDAVGGVINIIQRKDYSGTEAGVVYENTFDTDTAVTTLTLAHSFTAGRLSGSLSGSYQDRNAFAAVDRYFTATGNWQSLGGISSLRSIASGGLALGAGLVQAFSGNLPGRSSPWALIPDGADGSLRDASDYVSVPAADLLEHTGEWAHYQNLISPQRNRAVNLRMNYSLSGRSELYLESRYNEVATDIEGNPVNFRNFMVLPADYPGNPFGVPIRLRKTFWELGNVQGRKDASNDTMSAVAGLTGLFGRDWRYDVSVDWSRGRTRDENDYDPNLNTGNFNMALAGGTPPVLLYDSRDVMPNDPDELLLFLRAGGRQERSISQGLAVSVDGPVLELPAGPLRMAFGVDARRDTAKTAQAIPDPDGSSSSLVGDGFEREVSSAYAEAVAPLVSPAHDIPLVNRLDFTAAVRYDSYSDIGGDYSPRYGLQWRPVSWLMVRGTRNHAFRAPTMYDLYRRVVDGSFTFFAFDGLMDPLRNDEPLAGLTVDTIVGGNNNLKPERSASNNIGIVLDVPLAMFAGLSLSVDVVDFHYTDRIGGLGFEETFLLFPELVTRGDPLPGDPPGMPGPITRVDRRAVNTAETDILSIDYQVKYTRATSVGTFDLRAAATVYDSWESKSVPSAPAQSSSHFRPDRYTWQSYWTRGPLGLGLSGFHQARRFNDAARTTLRFGAATEWNSQMSYDFGKAGFSGRDSWLASILADSKVSLTIFNLFDREPPHLQGGRGGFAVTDPRMRRYSLSFQKTF